MAESATKETQEEFEARQDRERAEQALPEGAVPEQRPQAHQEINPDKQSERERKLKDEDEGPMDKSAYDKAASGAQLKKAEKAEKKLGPEMLRDGDKVDIVKGEFKGAAGVVVEVEFASQEDAQKYRSGDASVARFAKASSYMVRTRGQQHLVEVKPSEVELRTQPLGPNASEL